MNVLRETVRLRAGGRRRGMKALLVLTGGFVILGVLAGASAAAPQRTAEVSAVPYSFPVTLPAAKSSPSVDASAPYTPAVLSLIAQLEASSTPTQAQLAAADLLLHDTPANTASGWQARPTAFNPNNVSCHNVGPVLAPKGTTPSISDICWTDAQGVLNTSGPQARGSTGPMTLMGLGATFDRALGNAWGQTEGSESRAFMVTGMFGPQTDLDRLPNWGRNLTTTGEDPYLSHELVAAQINGMQGVGAMSEMKHFVVYNGQNQNLNTDIQDQGLHELYTTPYEGGFVNGLAAATMCSYQIWRDTSTSLPSTVSTLSATAPLSPYVSAQTPQTWPLNESHFSCEQPLSLNYILRDLWGSAAFVGSDYPATHSTSGLLQGEDQEMPTSNGFFSANDTLTTGQQTDATGSTCADAAGNWESCSTPGALHVGGIPNNFQGSGGSGCPNTYGCPLVDAVLEGNVPLSSFNQSLARVLYQEERFGLLGCEESSPLASCTNPGGVGGDRTGAALLPDGASGQLGTKNGDAAIVERYSEEGATLLKNDGNALPLTSSDLTGGILLTGANANHTVADPTNEASTGFIGRDSVNPLQQLQAFSGNPGAFTFVPANDPTGEPVPNSVLSSDGTAAGLGGLNLSVDGAPAVKDTTGLDRTAVSTAGQLAAGHTYTWTGYLYVPTSDTYTFAIQQSPSLPTTLNCPQTGQFGTPAANPTRTLCSPFTAANASQTNTPPDAVTFSLDGVQLNLNAVTANLYGATVPSNPTNAGYTEDALISRTCATTGALEPGTANCTAAQSTLAGGTFHQLTITVNNATGCVSTPPAAAAGTNPAVTAVPAPCTAASFRFAYSRAAGDIADAAAAAAGKSKAVVFVNDGVGASSQCPNPSGSPPSISCVSALSQASVDLINAVAAVNPNTIVVLNTANPVDTSWISSNVKAVLEMWFAGQEGGTSTARILLGQANPSGHTALTWPANRNDTIWGYSQNAPLYPGDTLGQHPERLNGNGGCTGTGCPAASQTIESEGIFTGYRYFDKLGITPQFPFGFGLSYTSFDFSRLNVRNTADGGLDVSFIVKNTGRTAGADAAQVYVGPPSDQPAGIQFAVRSLAQFGRVELAPGESRKLTLHVSARQLSYWSEAKQQWVLDAGGRTVFVGDADSSARLPLQATVNAPQPGDITCSNEQLNATTINGTLTVQQGDWCDLVDVTVNGNLNLHSVAGVRIAGSTISGSVESANASGAADLLSSGANVICNTTIGGHLFIQNSSAGSPWRLGSCGPDTVGGDVHFNNNAATGNTIVGNTIKGDLQCQGNASVSGSGNTVSGKNQGQCASF